MFGKFLSPTFTTKYRAKNCNKFSYSFLAVLGYILPLFSLILFTFFGGWLFSTLESSEIGPIKISSNNDSAFFGDTSISRPKEGSKSNDNFSAKCELINKILVHNLTEFVEKSRQSLLSYKNPQEFLQEISKKHKNRVIDRDIPADEKCRSKFKRFRFKLAWTFWKKFQDDQRATEVFVQGLLAAHLRKTREMHEGADVTILSRSAEKSSNYSQLGKFHGKDWNIWQSTLFAATLYTTIGYGNIAPETPAGRICAIFYSIVGIPLVLVILRMNGTALFNLLIFANHCIKKKTKFRQYQPIVGNAANFVSGPSSEQESSGGQQEDLPIYSSVFLVLLWMCLCAGLFLLWEDDWDYFTSWYFFFITMTTIGLGDVVPKYPQYTLLAFMLVIIGLSAVSMTFNIIQMKVEQIFDSIMEHIDAEYKLKQACTEVNRGLEGSGVTAADQMSCLYRDRTWKERLLFNLLMDKHRKQMLLSYYAKKSGTSNASTQTIDKQFAVIDIQCDIEEDLLDLLHSTNRRYIYNVKD